MNFVYLEKTKEENKLYLAYIFVLLSNLKNDITSKSMPIFPLFSK
jgi:hypothetical protein